MRHRAFELALTGALAAFAIAASPAAAQTRDCAATLRAWAIDPRMPKNCKCPPRCPTCEPVCPPRFSPPAAPWSGGSFGGSSRSFAAGMAGALIGGLFDFDSVFAPVEPDSTAGPDLEQLRRIAEAKRQAEEEKRRLLAEWKARQEQDARDRAEAGEKAGQRGRDLLERMHGPETAGGSSRPPAADASGGALEGFRWESPATAAEPTSLSGARFDTSGLKEWQRALCAAYFSQAALSAVRRDPEETRYFNEQATRAMAGQPVEVACRFPTLAELPEPARPEPSKVDAGPSMAMTLETLELFQARVADLQEIEVRLHELKTGKEDAEDTRRRAGGAVAEAETQRARAGVDDAALLAEIQRRLQEALRQREEADRRLAELGQEIDGLNQRKETIRRELQGARDRLQPGGHEG